MSKVLGDNYSVLRDDVRSFIVSFYGHVTEQNVVEIENDYQTRYIFIFLSFRFPKLTEQYFLTTRWPSADVIGQLVNHG